MRFTIPAVAALALLAFQAQAQNTDTTTTPAAPPAAAAPATPATPAAPVTKPMSHRQTLQQRFDAANAAHDGHLTKDEAVAAKWPYVVNNFAAMDKDKKGFVTVADIRAYAHARHVQHKTATTTQTKLPLAQPNTQPAAPAAPQ
jgi:hypothetical protein